MASSAPFGTDVQPVIIPRIVGGKMVYKMNDIIETNGKHSKEKNTPRTTGKDTNSKLSPTSADSLSSINTPVIDISCILTDCKAHSDDSLRFIEKHKLLEILSSRGLVLSDKDLTKLADDSKSLHIDYGKFMHAFNADGYNPRKPNLPTVIKPEAPKIQLKYISSSPPTCGSHSIQVPNPAPPVLGMKLPTSQFRDRWLCGTHHKESSKYHSCQTGLSSLESALKKCSNVSGNLRKCHCSRLIKLYNTMYRIGLPIPAIDDYIAGTAGTLGINDDGNKELELVNADKVIEFIQSILWSNQ